jgi:heme oxygenase (biliverdin-IX-beta and delta-forming)
MTRVRSTASSADSPDLLQRLKVETAAAHARIEEALDLDQRMRSIGDYRTFLARLYGFHAVWEPKAEALIADPMFFAPRRKLHNLTRDLRTLGLSPKEVDALPLCGEPLAMRSRAEAFGAMYVVEGSTLGGVIIARHINRALGPPAASACSYLRCYGLDLGRMWKAFGSQLLSLSAPGFDDEVVVSANKTFTVLQSWLQPVDRDGSLKSAALDGDVAWKEIVASKHAADQPKKRGS